MLNASAAAAGFDHALLWGLHDFLDGVRGQRGLELALSRESVGRVEQLRQHQKRPYCATFKMVALLHAMQRLSGEGDYVLWADSQRSSQLAALPAPAAGNRFIHAAIATSSMRVRAMHRAASTVAYRVSEAGPFKSLPCPFATLPTQSCRFSDTVRDAIHGREV